MRLPDRGPSLVEPRRSWSLPTADRFPSFRALVLLVLVGLVLGTAGTVGLVAFFGGQWEHSGLAVVAVLALVALLATSLARRLAQPVSALEQGVLALKQGEQATPIEPSGPSELRTLAATFNDMAFEVHSKRIRLTVANEQLRAEVAAREKAQQALGESEARLRGANHTLIQIARSAAVTGGDLPAALRIITEATAEGIAAARASVWTFSPDRRRLVCRDLYDTRTKRHSNGDEISAGDYPAYFASLQEDRFISAHTAVTDWRTCELKARYLEPLDIGAMLDTGVLVRGQLAGVLCIEHVGGTRRWTADEEVVAGALSDFVTLALESHRPATP